jgi:hypothetical protein
MFFHSRAFRHLQGLIYPLLSQTGINAASTWLIYQRGLAMGQEFRVKGANVAFGPTMNLSMGYVVSLAEDETGKI